MGRKAKWLDLNAAPGRLCNNDLRLALKYAIDREEWLRVIYVEMQRILHDEGGAVIPLFSSYVSAVSDKVALPDQMASNWGFDGEKAGPSRLLGWRI